MSGRDAAMLLATLLCLAGGACQPSAQPAKRPTIPTAALVPRITVHDHVKDREASHESKLSKPHQGVVTDGKTINEVIRILGRLGGGWSDLPQIPPSTDYTVVMYQNDEVRLRVWIGPNCLGAGPDEGEDLFQPLSQEDRKEPLDLLGINEKATPKK